MPKYSILAVDDEPFNLDLIEAAFTEFDNVDITYSLNGQEALELGSSNFIAKPYDIDVLCSRTINYVKLNYTTQQIKNKNKKFFLDNINYF